MEQHFNSYKEGLDLDFLRNYCVGHGRLVQLSRGEALEVCGQPSTWVGYVVSGGFKYMVHDLGGVKSNVTGFAFEGEFVADYPNCLYGMASEVTIVADVPSQAYVIPGSELARMYEADIAMMRTGRHIAEHLFSQTYTRFLDHYRLDARGRYEHLLRRCPGVVQQLSLKDIASFLNVTPQTISRLRRAITYGEP